MYPAFLDDELQIAPARAVRTQFDDGSLALRSPMALQFYAQLRRQVGPVAHSLLDLRLPAGRPIAIGRYSYLPMVVRPEGGSADESDPAPD